MEQATILACDYGFCPSIKLEGKNIAEYAVIATTIVGVFAIIYRLIKK